MRARLIAAITCLTLAGCDPAGDTPPQPVPPADAPASPAQPTAAVPTGADFSKDINTVGTEPFWAVDIRSRTLKLSRPDRPDLTAAHGGPAAAAGQAIWDAKAPDGSGLKVTLTVEGCSDGMSDLAYPYKAVVEAGGERLTGCAAPVDAWPKQPDGE